METKEAIEKINYNDFATLPLDDGRKIIKLLQQGEKYKQIVKEMESVRCGENGIFGYSRRKLVKELKQKYFPKEVNNGKNSINRSKGRRLATKKEKE